MPGELVILNEQLQILFPICDEIGVIIKQVKLVIHDETQPGKIIKYGEVYTNE